MSLIGRSPAASRAATRPPMPPVAPVTPMSVMAPPLSQIVSARLCGVHSGLALTIMIASLAMGVWCFVAAARDRWIDVTHLVGLGLIEGGLLVQAALALVAIGGGHRPGEYATFL